MRISSGNFAVFHLPMQRNSWLGFHYARSSNESVARKMEFPDFAAACLLLNFSRQ